MIKLETKAKTLSNLSKKNLNFLIPKFISFNYDYWKKNKKEIFTSLKKFKTKYLIARSSSYLEDNIYYSNAGKYLSINKIDIKDKKKIIKSVELIFKTFEKDRNFLLNEVIIQQSITNVSVSGVIFNYELNTGAPYYVINYDDKTEKTDTVTSGNSKYSNRTLFIFRDRVNEIKSKRWQKIISCTNELEKKVDTKYLDIEFCLTKDFKCYLFQVRPITTKKKWQRLSKKNNDHQIERVKKYIKKKFLSKNKYFNTVFTQMSDWNPAEMIGKIAKPLSVSLYKNLITNHTWSKGRAVMGYYTPKHKDLMEIFFSNPYINTKLSFESFTPKSLNFKLRKKIVDLWLEKLSKNPTLHDKIEFEVAFTNFTFDLKKKLSNQSNQTILKKEKKILLSSYLDLTRKFIDSKNKASVENQLKEIDYLDQLNEKNYKSKNNKIANLINDCKKYGTLPFSILARHGFVAKHLMISLKNLKILENKDLNTLFASVETVATEFTKDIYLLKKKKISIRRFVNRYGHLRPGTYNINNKNYKDSKIYNNINQNINFKKKKKFTLQKDKSKKIKRLLKHYNLFEGNPQKFIDYVIIATKAREYAKFVFTKTINLILEEIKKKLKKFALTADDIAYLDINFIKSNLHLDKKQVIKLKKKIKKEQNIFDLNSMIKIPSVFDELNGLYVIPFQINTPNYITKKKILSEIVDLDTKKNLNSYKNKINNKIVTISSADPGFDWIFSYKISGLITKYGGANSHMAIRCAEFNLPAAIGCGDQIYSKITNSKKILLDCQSNKIDFFN